MSSPVGVRARWHCSRAAGEGAWGAEAAERHEHHTASDNLPRALDSVLGDFEHTPANPKTVSGMRFVQKSHASSSSATSHGATATSAINAEEDTDPIKSILGDYEHVPVGKDSWGCSQQASEAPTAQFMPQLPPQEKVSAERSSMPPSSKSLAGCGGTFSRFQESGSVFMCLAKFRQPLHPAELASPTEESMQPSRTARISTSNGFDMGALHESRNITSAMEQMFQMHAAMFPANGKACDTSPHLKLTRQAIFKLGAEEFMMVLIHAHADLAWWSERYQLYSKGLITKCHSHLGHNFPSIWSWDKVSVYFWHAEFVNRWCCNHRKLSHLIDMLARFLTLSLSLWQSCIISKH